MKKQILTLSLCLALTATSALASGTSTVAKKAPAKTHVAVSKTVKPVTPVANKVQTPAPAVTLSPEQLAKQRFEEKMAQEREARYNALNLSAEQRTKAEALDQKHRAGAEPLFCKLHQERAKLHELKAKKACPVAICQQKQAVKAAKKDLKKYFETSKKEFEAILTPVQIAKLKTLEEARKASFKDHANGCKCPCCHNHKHHHHHGLAPVAAPAPTVAPCPCQGSAPAAK